MWKQVNNGSTINTVGSENGVIIKDEEFDLSARITIERNGETAPFSITCGIYGLFAHTAFSGNKVDAVKKYEEMKNEIQTFLLLNESLNEADVSDWGGNFANKY